MNNGTLIAFIACFTLNSLSFADRSSNLVYVYDLAQLNKINMAQKDNNLRYMLQVGAFNNKTNAIQYQQKLKKIIHETPIVLSENIKSGSTYYIISVGPLPRNALLKKKGKAIFTKVAMQNTKAHTPIRASVNHLQHSVKKLPTAASREFVQRSFATNTTSEQPTKVVSDIQPNTTVMKKKPTVSYDSLRIMAYSGRSDEAIQLAEQHLKNNENSSIRVLLARMLAWNKQFGRAKAQIQFVMAKNPGDYDAGDALADIEVMNGNYSLALKALDPIIKTHPSDKYLLDKQVIIRAKIAKSQGEEKAVIPLLEDYVKKYPSLNVRIYLADQYVANRQFEPAKKIYESILSEDNTNTEASIGLAKLEIALGDNSKALDIIKTGLKYDPANASLLSLDASTLSKLNVMQKNISYIPSITPNRAKEKESVVIQTETAKNSITFEEIQKLDRAGHRDRAIALAKTYLKNEDNGDIRVLLGAMLSWEKRYDEAKKELKMVLKKSPDRTDASIALVNVDIWSNHPKDALEDVNNGLRYHPKDKDLLKQKHDILNKSMSYEQLNKMAHGGDREKAKILAAEYLKNNQNDDVRLLLGLMHSWDKNYVEAKQQFETILKNKPGYTEASLGLANVDFWNDDYQQALNTINSSLKYHPGDPELLKKRSEIMQKMNETSYVTGLFDLANQVGPSTPGKKMNAFRFSQLGTYVDDLQQYWSITSIGYERYTSYGPVIFTLNQTYRFGQQGTQYLVEAYPHLFKGSYAYVGYGHSDTSYLAKNYIGFEPYFSLPNAYEISIGERILQFTNTTHLYTGSIGKYIGNYWFSVRPYYSSGRSQSYSVTARRYFSTPDSYMSMTIAAGVGSNVIDLFNPNSISADRSRSIRLNGNAALTQNFILTWLAALGYEHYPNDRERNQADMELGFIWRF